MSLPKHCRFNKSFLYEKTFCLIKFFKLKSIVRCICNNTKCVKIFEAGSCNNSDTIALFDAVVFNLFYSATQFAIRLNQMTPFQKFELLNTCNAVVHV